MAATGNAVANSYWEAKISSTQKPHYESSDLEPFIRRKYCNKEFAEGTWPPALPDEATTSASAPQGAARQAQGASASAATASGATPQLASDPSAGKLQAGGFWGTLTPQESSTTADLLSDSTPSASLTAGRPQQQRQSPQLSSLSSDSPALLIDLMDFGAESTFQLPTTPRRQSTSAGSTFGSASNDGVAGIAASGAVSSNKGTAYSNGNASRPAGVREEVPSSSVAAPAAAATGLRKHQSSFPLLPPPPQVRALASNSLGSCCMLLQHHGLHCCRALQAYAFFNVSSFLHVHAAAVHADETGLEFLTSSADAHAGSQTCSTVHYCCNTSRSISVVAVQSAACRFCQCIA